MTFQKEIIKKIGDQTSEKNALGKCHHAYFLGLATNPAFAEENNPTNYYSRNNATAYNS